MEFTIGLDSPMSLDYTLDSGQVFRWENKGEWWYGVVSGGALKLKQEGETLQCSSSSDLLDSAFVRGYFRLEDDMHEVLVSIRKDEVMTRAVQSFYGLRLIRQERWECLASFLLATNSNIPRIRRMVASVCERYGKRVRFEGSEYSTFPTPEALADAPIADLQACGLGYRAPFLKRVAQSVDQGRIDFSEVALLEYPKARALLLKELFGEKLLLGVGPKVADCVLLFSCGKDEAFPIDVWIARSLANSYPNLVEPRLLRKLLSGKKISLTKWEYDRLGDAARDYFGPFAGFAQQYLFMLARYQKGA